MRSAVAGVGLMAVLAVALGAQPAGAQPTPCPSFTPIVLAGQTNLAFVDVNRNGMIDANDCVVTGVGMPMPIYDGVAQGQMCFSAVQGGPPYLAGCNGDYGGSAYLDASSGSGMATQDFGNVSIAYRSGSSSSLATAAGLPGFPVRIRVAEVTDGPTTVGEGSLCSEGGPAIAATVRGVTGVARFERKTVGGAPYLCSNLPFPTVPNGMQTFPLCISSGNGSAIDGGLQNGDTYVQFPLNGLPECGASRGAPSANEWGLLGLATALLVLGTWMLRRMPRFGSGLPSV